ncbi:MAG: flagellar motor protein MotD [Halieaceae bacterium]|nr:flagellar motor protein MotD [Halieaceae bacterium]
MARKRPPEEEENHERWLVSYADFITLLFAFFVVMYSVSSVNEGKYRVLSESLTTAFSPGGGSLSPIRLGTGGGAAGEAINPGQPDGKPMPFPTRPLIFQKHGKTEEEATAEEQLTEAREEIEALSGEVSKMLSRYIESDLVNIKQNDLWLEIEIRNRLLFDSGSARPAASARPILRQLAAYFAFVPNNIRVEGYTDNQPISTPLFPSNWELSSGRAAAVVRLLVQYGVQPERLMSVGYAEFRPVADNDSIEGRIRNRRVVIKLLAGEPAREEYDLRGLQALQSDYRGVDSG